MAATSSAVGTAYAINIGIALLVFLSFSWIRLRGWARRFYAPKRYDTSLERKPRRLPPGFFGWMRVIFTYPENEVTEVAGLDSVVYLRVLRFGWETLVKIALVTCVILLPINITSDAVTVLLENQTQPSPPPSPPPPSGCAITNEDDVQPKIYTFTNFDRLSLTNVPAGDPKLWAYVVTVYIVTAIVLLGLHRYNKEATLLRLAFLANAPRGGPSHTTLITDIPGMRYGTIIWYLRSLVGSTLFVMLPKSVKQKVLDTMESGIDKGFDTLNVLDKIPPLESDFGRDSSVPTAAGSSTVRDAYVKGAEYNSFVADAEETARQKKATGVLTNRKRNKENMIQATDENLDPWKQAGDVLGDMNQPDANKVKGFIHDEMEMTYGKGCVAAVNPVWDQGSLDPLIEEYHNLRQKLEDYVDDLSSKLKRRKHIKKKLKVTVIPALLGSWGIERYGLQPIKVDAIIYWSERLKFLVDEAIPAAQKECLTKAIPTAFVTVQTRHTQMIMTGTLHHHDENTWQMQGAPEPKEIIWGNLPMRRWERGVRTIVLWAGYFLLLFFFMIPIAAVQALIEVPKLASVPVLGEIVNWPLVRQILEAILPGLILLIFLALLPTILAWMCRLSGMVSTSQVDFGVVTRYFYFQVCSVVVGSIIAGSLFSQLKQFIAQPTSIIQILGVAIPMTATFFINYMLTAGVARMAIQHLRIPGLVIFWLLSKVAATPRARARLWSDQYTLYGPTVAYHMIAFLLGLTYSCINPVMGPTAVIYFSVAIISERYNNLYVFKRVYESGGRLWIDVFNQFIFCLYFMQIIMIILLSVKKFPFVPLLVPLPFITFAFHVLALSDFRRPWTIMSAHDAAQLDINDARDRNGEALTPADLQQIQDMYLSPAFKVKPEDMVDLLREAETVRHRVDGEKREDIEAAVEDQTFVDAVDALEHDDDTTPRPTANSTGNLDTSSVKVAITEVAEGSAGASYSGASTARPAVALSVTKPKGPSSVASAPETGVAGSHASTTTRAPSMALMMSTQGSGTNIPLLTPKDN